MRIINFLPAALFLGMAACNNASDKTASTTDSTQQTVSHDSMAMPPADSSATANVMPPVPDGAKVYFKNLKDGDKVKSPFKVEMGIDGLTVDTAGAIVPGTGHHHLLIDAGDSIPSGQVVPKDAQHLHFGKGQTSTEVTLPAGQHVLTLQFADGIHRSYGSKLAATITVTVQ
jgi:uncharacterized protein DUF4399